MIRPAIIVLSTLVVTAIGFASHTAHACSCMAPGPELLAPSHQLNAPLNTHVRVVLPVYPKGQLVLRKHRGADVPTKRIDSPLQNISHVSLVPEKPLDAETRYEVALIRTDHHPSTLVFGTFVTGKTSDTTAPAAPKITRTTVNAYRGSAMTSCAVHTPWAEVFLNPANDPDRDDAQLLYAVWAASGKGTIDLNAPPTAYLQEEKGKLKLGRTSYCDPQEFPLPTSGTVALAIVAIDESGNRSAPQRTSLTMSVPLEAQQP